VVQDLKYSTGLWEPPRGLPFATLETREALPLGGWKESILVVAERLTCCQAMGNGYRPAGYYHWVLTDVRSCTEYESTKVQSHIRGGCEQSGVIRASPDVAIGDR
jgi:hypothetical protein